MPDQLSDYTRLQRNPARIAAIIGAVVVFHVCLILAFSNWFGQRAGRHGPILIEVKIFPDKPAPGAAATRHP